MSVVKEALDAVREAIKLVDEVKRTAGRLLELTIEVRDIDRRVSKLEGKWDAAIDFGKIGVARSTPRMLPGKQKKR